MIIDIRRVPFNADHDLVHGTETNERVFRSANDDLGFARNIPEEALPAADRGGHRVHDMVYLQVEPSFAGRSLPDMQLEAGFLYRRHFLWRYESPIMVEFPAMLGKVSVDRVSTAGLFGGNGGLVELPGDDC